MQDTSALSHRPASLRSSDALAIFMVRAFGPRAARWLAHPLAQAFGRFLSVGVVGLAADAAVFSALDHSGIAPEVSRAVSLLIATVLTWRLNRTMTFGASGRSALSEALRYGAVALLAQGFSYSVFLTLVYELPAMPRLFALLAGAGLAAFAGFAGHRFFAFSPARAPVSRPRSAP